MVRILKEALLTIDSLSPGTPDELIKDKDGDVSGTLQLLHIGDDQDIRDEVPAVPG
jgi:hypothetical protein